MLVPLYMFHAKLIQSPMFYISAFFEARRDEYCDKLLAVSKDDDWTGWCVFFLNTVDAGITAPTAKRILQMLKQEGILKTWIRAVGGKLLSWLSRSF